MFVVKINRDESCEWFEINSAGEVASKKTFFSLQDCPCITSDDHITMIVPGENIVMHSVQLPRMRFADLKRAIPFALEEQLACDPDNIDIVIGTQKPSGVVVAITEKNWLGKKVIAWNQIGLYPSVIIPDYFSFSAVLNAWVIVVEKNYLLIRMNDDGIAIERENFSVWFGLFLKKNTAKHPKKIILHCIDNFAQSDLALVCNRFSISLEITDTYPDLFQAINSAPINLFDEKYRSRTQSSYMRKLWSRCCIVAGSWLALMFVSNLTQLLYFHFELAKINQKTLMAYQQLFPGSDQILEPRYRTNALLKKYQNASGNSVFLKLFSIAGKTVLQFPDITVNSVQFHNDRLRFSVSADNKTAIRKWIALMQKNNLMVINKNSMIEISESR